MTERSEHLLSYLVFLGTALLGFFGAAWWSIIAPVLLLAALR
ncbi:MAG: hypothetical protein AB7V13_13750 [Pseudorhodoplanes sp.]